MGGWAPGPRRHPTIASRHRIKPKVELGLPIDIVATASLCGCVQFSAILENDCSPRRFALSFSLKIDPRKPHGA
jgi:hypothetical protein